MQHTGANPEPRCLVGGGDTMKPKLDICSEINLYASVGGNGYSVFV